MRPAAAHLFKLSLRRAVLIAARDIDNLQGVLDCGEMALGLGHRDEARLFFETAFIVGGYDGAALRAQDKLRQETGLWEPTTLRSAHPLSGTSHQDRVDAAIATLRTCLALPRPVASLSARSSLSTCNQDAHAGQAGLFSAIHALHVALQSPFECTHLDTAISAVCRHPFVSGEIRLEENVDAPLRMIAALFAAKVMRHFFSQRYDLALGMLASPALLHEAAGLERDGLGPYFSHAANLVPTLDTLITIAMEAADTTTPELETQRALVMLAAGLQAVQLRAFVDMLADRGLLPSLQLIAQRFCFVLSPDDRPLLWALRDAFIDLGEGELPTHLQQLLCKLAPHSATEASILLNLQANALHHGIRSSPGQSRFRRGKLQDLTPFW